jgi:hypothetical protein
MVFTVSVSVLKEFAAGYFELNFWICGLAHDPHGKLGLIERGKVNDVTYACSIHTAISIKVVPRAKRKSRIRARKAAGNR